MKIAYPNIEDYISIPNKRDVNKWVDAAKLILSKENEGVSVNASINKYTNGWSTNEVFDFLNWFKFYRGNNHLKYKFAQTNFWENPDTGYILPIHNNNINDIVKSKEDDIFKFKTKLISRLNSVEKLLSSREGSNFIGEGFDELMNSIYSLKSKIHNLKKVSTSTKTYDDMIIREANILSRKGFVKAASLLYSTAQAVPQKAPTPASAPINMVPPVTPGAKTPWQGSGVAGGLPATTPGSAALPNESAESGQDSIGIDSFLERFEPSSDDENDSIDNLEVHDEIIVEAQALPTVAPPTPKNNITPINKPNQLPESPKSFDDKIEQVLSNITVDDIVSKLEDVSKIYKTKEIPRQLSIADMMLDSLGLASFFPALSEAQNKSLESTNYIITRIDDVISKLRGAMKANDVDLLSDNDNNDPNIMKIKKNLNDNIERENAKKQIRKEKELNDAELDSDLMEAPQIDIDEDLSKPTTPISTPKSPIAPIAPPNPTSNVLNTTPGV